MKCGARPVTSVLGVKRKLTCSEACLVITHVEAKVPLPILAITSGTEFLSNRDRQGCRGFCSWVKPGVVLHHVVTSRSHISSNDYEAGLDERSFKWEKQNALTCRGNINRRNWLKIKYNDKGVLSTTNGLQLVNEKEDPGYKGPTMHLSDSLKVNFD
ncbi:hypothetical protein C2857_006039 [Epichloe festucae Fl1]|uniref:Uncharacterized protein n=1 Tax=Epichloe festucae (strain Fl1) TaxID=877507 RepID=A0A7S9KLH0_EPIFF|nr:hypothetical protein C2857_006039 [Epichloe festucae Fl1]